MATDPIRRIRHKEPDLMTMSDYYDILTELAALPPSHDAPYLTLCLDWRTHGSEPGRRLGFEQFRREGHAAIERFWPRGVAFDSVSTDVARIQTYLEEELDPAAHGAFIVACAVQGVFEAVPLVLPLDTALTLGPIPALSPLAQLVEDHVPYAVLVADQREAVLSLVVLAAFGPALEMTSSDYPRKQHTGGWSQRRYQTRADERVAAFARGIAEETATTLAATGARFFILAGDEIMTSALHEAFSADVAERLAATVRLDINATPDEILAATWPIAQAWEREQERADVEQVRALALGEGRATYGAETVLRALATGQAQRLIFNDDFRADGWADYSLPVYGVGAPPAEHPAGGAPDALDATELREEMIRLALLTGATIQIVHSAVPVDADTSPSERNAGDEMPRSEPARNLDELGGVGALLRYQITPE
ncbi:MAG: hypothetical protein DCC58_19980 [Chloroflexi bacterium]|nr:MAG: hypothetical protein DCC58_19980 [Chloroflexota bacterium]